MVLERKKNKVTSPLSSFYLFCFSGLNDKMSSSKVSSPCPYILPSKYTYLADFGEGSFGMVDTMKEVGKFVDVEVHSWEKY